MIFSGKSGAILTPLRDFGGHKIMQLTVVVENFCTNRLLRDEWGYCLYLESEKTHLMLDTGSEGHALTHNLQALRINPKAIEHIVFSHAHFDHTGGLVDAILLAPQARRWGSKEMSRQRWSDADQKRNGGGGPLFKSILTDPIDSWAQVTEEVIAFTVPQTARDPRFVNSKNMWEQKEDGAIVPDTFADDLSLLVKGDKGVSVVLGCAHAGLPNILNYAQKTFDIREFDTVLGGTHLSAAGPDELPLWIEALKQFKVKCWRPNHCTGFKAAAAMARAFDDVDWAGCGTKLIL